MVANIVALASDEKSEITGNNISEFFLIFPSQNGGNSGWNLFSEVGTSCSWKVTSNHLTLKEAFQMDAKKIRQQWESQGLSFGIFRDPLGRVWPDFSHSIEEVVILAEGQVEIEIEGQMHRSMVGEEILSQPRPSLLSVLSERCQMFGTTDIE